MGLFGSKKTVAAPSSEALGQAFVQAAMAQMMGKVDEFESYFRQNERAIRAGARGDSETTKQLSTVLHIAAIVAMQKGRFPEAEEKLREAVQLARKYPAECQLTRKLSDLGNCYYTAGRKDEALRSLEEAVELERSTVARGQGSQELLAQLLSATATVQRGSSRQ